VNGRLDQKFNFPMEENVGCQQQGKQCSTPELLKFRVALDGYEPHDGHDDGHKDEKVSVILFGSGEDCGFGFHTISFYRKQWGISIVRGYIVRKYSVRLPEGTIVGRWRGSYTVGKFSALSTRIGED